MLLAISEPILGSDLFTSTVRTLDVNPQTFAGSNLQVVATLPADTRGKFNNGNCGPDGKYFVGTFEYGKEIENKGKVWVLRPNVNGSGYVPTVVIDNIGHPNGLLWRKNYWSGGWDVLFARTFINAVEEYDYNTTSGDLVGEPKQLVTLGDDDGLLDSMCGLDDGSFLVADPHNNLFRHYHSNGDLKCTINVPIEGSPFVASCAFAGDDLYITSGRNGGDTDGKSGKLYRIRGVVGGRESFTCDIQPPESSLVIV